MAANLAFPHCAAQHKKPPAKTAYTHSRGGPSVHTSSTATLGKHTVSKPLQLQCYGGVGSYRHQAEPTALTMIKATLGETVCWSHSCSHEIELPVTR